MPSSIRFGHRRLAAAAGFALTVGFTLTGCGPVASGGGSPAGAVVSSPAAPSSSAPATVTPTPTPTPTVAVIAPPPAPVETTPPPAEPTATAKAAVTTKAAEPRRTTAAPTTAAPPAGGCEIVSNAGNCYQAGQFCRNADLGRTTHDAAGRLLYCRMVSGKPHWQT
ncbi:hypothetical protein KCMC57_up32360 [Kitasatospora sp. CMC57]|uniref:Uncharacterized protein n=1 Tax=Kitasatospora sp. CMC57 TaxID=3231513 RepID=A0AB33JW01_9ACTN